MDLMGEAKRVAGLCELGAVAPCHASSPDAPLGCECITADGSVGVVLVGPHPTLSRVPVQHSASSHGFPPLGIDGVDAVFAKYKRLAHLPTSLFGVYDGHFGKEAAQVRFDVPGLPLYVGCFCVASQRVSMPYWRRVPHLPPLFGVLSIRSSRETTCTTFWCVHPSFRTPSWKP